jgi:hypothetical protein
MAAHVLVVVAAALFVFRIAGPLDGASPKTRG